MLCGDVLSEVTMLAATIHVNSAIIRQQCATQLNDSLAMTMRQTKFTNDYLEYDSDAGLFMIALLFPLTCRFSAIT